MDDAASACFLQLRHGQLGSGLPAESVSHPIESCFLNGRVDYCFCLGFVFLLFCKILHSHWLEPWRQEVGLCERVPESRIWCTGWPSQRKTWRVWSGWAPGAMFPVFIKRGVFFRMWHWIRFLSVSFCSVTFFLFVCFVVFLNFIRPGSFLLRHKLTLFWLL